MGDLQGSSLKLKRVMVRLLYRWCGKDYSTQKNDTIDDMNMEDIGKLAQEIKYRRSAGKLYGMLQAYENDGFCSFWG